MYRPLASLPCPWGISGQTHCALTPISEPQIICLTLASKNPQKTHNWEGSNMNWGCEKMNPDERCGNIHMDSSSGLDEEEMNCNTHAFILLPPAPRGPCQHPVTPLGVWVRIKSMSATLQRWFKLPSRHRTGSAANASKQNLSKTEFRNYHWLPPLAVKGIPWLPYSTNTKLLHRLLLCSWGRKVAKWGNRKAPQRKAFI